MSGAPEARSPRYDRAQTTDGAYGRPNVGARAGAPRDLSPQDLAGPAFCREERP